MGKLILEINEKYKGLSPIIQISKDTALILTPPINKDYWAFRVKLHKDQAILAFTKFGPLCFAIGFAIEDEDWNTNLLYSNNPERIYSHILENKKYDEITKEMCIEAIILIQKYIMSFLPENECDRCGFHRNCYTYIKYRENAEAK